MRLLNFHCVGRTDGDFVIGNTQMQNTQIQLLQTALAFSLGISLGYETDDCSVFDVVVCAKTGSC